MSQTASPSSQPLKKKGGYNILVGIILAIIFGVIVGGWFPEVAVHTEILGEIFLNLLKMIVVPLVMLSMIVGITGLGDVRHLGTIGGRTVFFYMTTTALAVLVGIILVNIINPGKGVQHGEEHPEFTYVIEGEDFRTVTLTEGVWAKQKYDANYVLVLQDQKMRGVIESVSEKSVRVKIWELVRSGESYYVPSEDGTVLPFRNVKGELKASLPRPESSGKGVKIELAIAKKVKGKEGKGMGDTLEEVILGDPAKNKEGLIPRNLFNAMVNMDILPLIFFSLLLGAALSVMGARAQGVIDGFSVLNDAVMKIVHGIMYVAPIGIFGLIAARIGLAGGFQGFWPELVAVGKYFLTVVLGLFIHGCIVLPAILWIFGRRSPLQYARGMGTALLNAFSTASSSATLPLTMEGVEKENGISNRTASFVLPLGATINMDGTALYEAVAAIFIAQVYGYDLGLSAQVIIALTATLAAIGAAGIPEAGLVTMVIVLKAVDLPIEGIGLILSIDWLLDRFRTTVNVWGDAVGAGVIETLEAQSSSQSKNVAPKEVSVSSEQKIEQSPVVETKGASTPQATSKTPVQSPNPNKGTNQGNSKNKKKNKNKKK